MVYETYQNNKNQPNAKEFFKKFIKLSHIAGLSFTYLPQLFNNLNSLEQIAQSKQDIHLIIEALGANTVNEMMGGRFFYPIHFGTELYGINVKETKDYFYSLMNMGLRADLGTNALGTFLHHILANELEEPSYLKQIMLPFLSKPSMFNFAYQDGEGKTALLIAVKTRRAHNVKALLEWLQEYRHIDLGVNTPDHNGCTPILLAFALGMANVVPGLIHAGARLDIKDKKGRGVYEYSRMNALEVTEILKSIHIEPSRAANAPHNWVYNCDGAPICYFDEQGEKHTVLLSKARKDKFVIQQLLSSEYVTTDVTGENNIKIREQYRDLENEDLLSVCLKDQEACQVILQQKEQALRDACALGNIETTQKLLTEGVNPNSTDLQGRTAFHYTVMREELGA